MLVVYRSLWAILLTALFLVPPLQAQDSQIRSKPATYKKVNSLRESMAEYRRRGGPPSDFIAIPNKPWRPGKGIQDLPEVLNKLESTVQSSVANGPVVEGISFQALSGVDGVTPADPTGDVGPNHIVVGVNTSITVFDKSGSVVPGGQTADADALWAGTTCEGGSNGDPIILYDEGADRWVVALVHFERDLLCIAASASGDPLGAYHDYVFSFNQLPDYAKIGVTSDHLVVTAHMFGAFFSGTLLGTIDKSALYAGQPVNLLYGTGYPYGYLPVDVDGASDQSNPLFVGFENSSTLRVYELQNINYGSSSANLAQLSNISFPSVDRSVCSAYRGQCIDQPANWDLESLDGRLMHRAQLRDMGSRESIVVSQTVNAGGERAGIAWYEIRDTGSGWQGYQDGIYAPADGEYRWIPSIAMNAAGDIGMSFMRSSGTVFPSVSVVGQTSAEGAGATGLFDSSEITCATGSSSIDQTYQRSGDYAATIVDPVTDRFWAIQQYGYPGVWADWGVWVCEFEVDGTPPEPEPPVAEFSASPTSGEAPLEVSFTDLSANAPTSWSWDFGDTGSSSSQNPTHTYTSAGSFTVTLTATNAEGSDGETKVDYITVTEPAPVVDHVAQSVNVQQGTSSGGIASTHSNNGVSQVLTEEVSNGNPARRRSSAQATWAFSVRSGKPATFYLNGWHSPSLDGDDFEFSYSTDNSNFISMFELTDTSDGPDYHSFVIGITPSSQMWIRVEDTNNDQGGTNLDDLFVDHMFIRTEGSTPPAPAAITDLEATAVGYDAVSLSWTDVADEVGYSVERHSGGGSFTEVAVLSADESSYLDEGLTPATSYTYRVGPYNAGGTTWSNEVSATTGDPPAGQAVHVEGMSGSGTDKNSWIATVTTLVHNHLGGPESGVLVSGSWSGGESGSAACTTDASGQCGVEIRTRSTSVTFTVNDLQKTAFTYDDTKDFATPPALTVLKGQISGGPAAAKSSAEIPDALSLEQNYPNPFNPVTILSYGIPEAEHVTVSVFNALGVEVVRLQDGGQDAGWHRVAFDGTNLSSGLYVAVVRSGGALRSKTMLLAK